MTEHILRFECRMTPFSDQGQSRQITATADTLLAFLTPYIEVLLKSDQIRSIVLVEGGNPTRLAEFPDEIGELKQRLRALVAADRVESLV